MIAGTIARDGTFETANATSAAMHRTATGISRSGTRGKRSGGKWRQRVE